MKRKEGNRRTCVVCGKEFLLTGSALDYFYKFVIRSRDTGGKSVKYCCSYTCWLKFDPDNLQEESKL